MRKTVLAITAICMSSAVVGCNQKSTAKAPSPGIPDSQAPQGYSIKMASRCDGDEENCIGLHGFTVFSDGHYQVGPGPAPENIVRTGTLTSDEMNSFNSALGVVLPTPQLGAENRMTVNPPEGAEPYLGEDTITFVHGNGTEETLLRYSGSELTYKVRSADDAKAILGAIRKLAEAHYELPFPDDCRDRTVPELERLFSSMQTCSADSDCILLDSAFDPIERSSGEMITADDCSLVRGLPTANLSAVKAERARLEQLTSDAYNACGPRMYRADCSVSQFMENGTPATCRQGVCQLPAAPSTPSLH